MFPGKPRVPVIRRLISGDTTGITISIAYAESTAKFEIPPAPYPISKGSKPGALIKDPTVYEKDAFYPEKPYSFHYIGMRRSKRYYTLEIHPYQYNPIKKRVRYAKSIDIKGIGKIESNKERDADTLLIVTPEKFLSTMDFLIFYKEVCGFTVETLVVEPSWGIARIREEIISWQPDYLLLVGDTSEIPAFQRVLYIPDNDFIFTDLYYACVDSDYLPDMYYGRLSVENTQELRNIIKKIINYDSLKATWKSRAFFIASSEPTWHSLAEETHKYSMEKVRLEGMVVDSNFGYYSDNPGTPLEVAFSEGRSISVYSGHGGKYSWNGPFFDIADIEDLPPNLRTPVVFSFACLTGTYEEDDCFMEEWNTAEDKGSVISFGSSALSYWNEDDLFERRIFDVLSSSKDIGTVIDTAKLLFARDYTGESVYIESYYQQYNLLGDPTLRVRTGNSEKTSLNIPTIAVVNESISSYTDSNGRIGIIQVDRKVIMDADSRGRVEIPLNGFVSGIAKVLAQSGDKLITTKLIHLAPEPLEDIFQIEQNITIDIFNVKFFAIGGTVEAHLYDCMGRQIEEKSWAYISTGEKRESWNIQTLPPGIYFLEVNQEDFWRFTGKIIKL